MNTNNSVKTALTVALSVCVGIVVLFVKWVAVLILAISMFFIEDIEEHTDIENYTNYFGSEAVEPYRYKLLADDIFPEKITENMRVEDFKMVYYNPFDPQYLSYLVVEYDEAEYQTELKRLGDYGVTEYIGYYGATGFDDKYTLLAMNADSYNGFVYALAADGNKIIYVEILFCNYFMDLEYQDYIKEEYLPLGFDATHGNPYQNNR